MGLAIGIPIGMPVGLAIGNIALGPAIGLVIGLILGFVFDSNEKEQAESGESGLVSRHKVLTYLLIFGIVLFIEVMIYIFFRTPGSVS